MWNNMTKTLSVMIGLAVMTAGVCSAAGVGTTGAQFLKISPGARAVAMGGAFSAVADDLYAIYWNPAGLAGQDGRQAAASYVQYFQGISIGFLGYSQPCCRGTLGFGVNYLTLGDIEKRTTDADTPEGTFGANDMAVSVSYASDKLLKVRGLKLGATVKLIRQTIDTTSAQAYALDIGSLYQTPVKNLTASLGVYNLGTAVKFTDEGDPLPLDVRLGGAYRLMDGNLVIAADMDSYVNDARLNTGIGAEYLFRKMISVRAGYKLGTDASRLGGLTGLTAGVGFNVWGVLMDYAFVPFGELNDTHRISLSAKF